MLLSPSLFSLEKNMLHCDDIELFFISPADGLTISESQFKVQFGSKNISISPAGVGVERIKDCNVSGHHHLIINRSYDVREYAELPIPFDANILHFGGGQTEATLSLPPGKYTLQLALGDYEHMPVQVSNSNQTNGLAVSKIVSIEIL